jgi:hypothetical protein
VVVVVVVVGVVAVVVVAVVVVVVVVVASGLRVSSIIGGVVWAVCLSRWLIVSWVNPPDELLQYFCVLLGPF